MVQHVLYAIPKRYINNMLVVKISDIYEEYRTPVYEYARLNNGIAINGDGHYQDDAYISNKVFCKFIKEDSK